MIETITVTKETYVVVRAMVEWGGILHGRWADHVTRPRMGH